MAYRPNFYYRDDDGRVHVVAHNLLTGRSTACPDLLSLRIRYVEEAAPTCLTCICAGAHRW